MPWRLPGDRISRAGPFAAAGRQRHFEPSSCNTRARRLTTAHDRRPVHQPVDRRDDWSGRAARAWLLSEDPPAGDRAGDCARDRGRPVRAWLGQARPAGLDPGADRARLPAVPVGVGDRRGAASGPDSAGDGAGLRVVVRDRDHRRTAVEGGRLRQVTAVRGDRLGRDLAWGDRSGPQGLGQRQLQLRSARDRGRLDRGFRRDHPAVGVLLGQGLVQHRGDADPAGAVRAGGGRDRARDRRRRALDGPVAGDPAAAGHHGPGPRSCC